MENFGMLEILIIAINVIVSYWGFNNRAAFDAGLFRVGSILQDKEYYRLVSSGFLHVSWSHLALNMLSLYFFAGQMESYLGPLLFLLVYMGSLIGGNLFSLFINRNKPYYTAVGASGAVSGVVFAAIALFPGMQLGFLFIPIPFPAWAFGLGFVLYSIYGIKNQKDNVGHEAHLGGAVIGLLIALAINPQMIFHNTLAVALILIPTVVFIIILLRNPDSLGVKPTFYTYYPPEEEENNNDELELNRILEKMKSQGGESLTSKEKDFLEKYGR